VTTDILQPTAATNEVEEARKWLIDHKTSTRFSWSELSRRTGIATGTISQFGSEKAIAAMRKRSPIKSAAIASPLFR
jgi:hypothetical protein